jgi:hypothetical protein
MVKYKVNDFVELLDEKPNSINKEARVNKVDGDYVFVSNLNMPFIGTLCNKKLHKSKVKKI